HGLENFKVLKGIVIEPGAATTVSVLAEPGQMRDGLCWVPVQLVSRDGQRQVMHARADVLLAEIMPAAPANILAPSTHRNGNGAATVYGNGRLFHGPHFHGIEAMETCSATDVMALVKSAPAPKHWIHHPLRTNWMSDPLALDASFQMMILWSWEHRQAASLPCALKRFRQFATAFPKAGSRVKIQITSADSALVTADIHFFDRQGGLLALAEGYECVVDSALQEAFHLNHL
ncbi:MAG: polyketide synthase dehydratase domain-containing protein, partial [Verrucomicrobiota bacterium]